MDTKEQYSILRSKEKSDAFAMWNKGKRKNIVWGWKKVHVGDKVTYLIKSKRKLRRNIMKKAKNVSEQFKKPLISGTPGEVVAQLHIELNAIIISSNFNEKWIVNDCANIRRNQYLMWKTQWI